LYFDSKGKCFAVPEELTIEFLSLRGIHEKRIAIGIHMLLKIRKAYVKFTFTVVVEKQFTQFCTKLIFVII
jgi:hypothetical protein